MVETRVFRRFTPVAKKIIFRKIIILGLFITCGFMARHCVTEINALKFKFKNDKIHVFSIFFHIFFDTGAYPLIHLNFCWFESKI